MKETLMLKRVDGEKVVGGGGFMSLAIDMAGRRCLVVGGGRIGTRKALALHEAGAEVVVVSPRISQRLQKLVRLDRIDWHQREYRQRDQEGAFLVIAATSSGPLNTIIGLDAKKRGVLCCVVSSAADSSVVFPAVHADAGITIGRRGVDRPASATKRSDRAWHIDVRKRRRVTGGEVFGSFPKSDSLVIMMGVAALDQIVARLLADGWPADTKTAIIERGTLAWERRVCCPLDRLSATGGNAAVSSPACLIVGNAATPLFASRQRPTIMFTGLDPSNFRTLGNLIHWPALEVVPDQQSRHLLRRTFPASLESRFDWIVFVDKLGVMSFFEELDRQRLDARTLAGVKIATVGAMTAGRLGEHGLRPDLLLEAHALESTRGLRRQFADKSFMIVEGSHLSRRLHEFLVGCNAQVDHFIMNQVIPNRQLGRILPEHDVVYFVSPCGVRAYFSEYGHAAFQKEAWCLGRDTECVLAGYGIKAKIVIADKVIADNGAESAALVSA